MSVPLPGALGRDTDEFPWFKWGVPVTLDVAKMASAVQESSGSIAVHVDWSR